MLRFPIHLLTFTAFMLALMPSLEADVYSWDFLSGDFDNLSLTPFGDGAVNLVRPTPKGLRLRLPIGEKSSGIGFATRFQLRGDFEITMRYQITKLERPKDGWGVGPCLYLTTVAPLQPAAQLSRLARKDKRQIHSIFRALPIDGERTKLHKQFDTDAKYGRLRISRVGSIMTWSVGRALSTEFDVLHEDEFDTADVGLVRVSLQQSAPSTGGEILIEHLSIVADDLPHLPSERAQNDRVYVPQYTPKPVVPSRSWMIYLACAVLLTAGTVTWFVRRRRGY